MVATSAIRSVVWLLLAAYVAVVCVVWMLSDASTLVHQCKSACQVAALVVVGYVLARCVVAVCDDVDRALKQGG